VKRWCVGSCISHTIAAVVQVVQDVAEAERFASIVFQFSVLRVAMCNHQHIMLYLSLIQNTLPTHTHNQSLLF